MIDVDDYAIAIYLSVKVVDYQIDSSNEILVGGIFDRNPGGDGDLVDVHSVKVELMIATLSSSCSNRRGRGRGRMRGAKSIAGATHQKTQHRYLSHQ